MDLSLTRYLTAHPLNRRTRLWNLPAMLRWHIGTRLLGNPPVVMPFVNGSRLIAVPGRWGSEANALCGLHEFADMGFLLHLLRPTDLFCDVGANVGSFTVLASAARGARTHAFEPIPATFADLTANIAVNQVGHLVEAHRLAMGRGPGELRFTTTQDTTNHVSVTTGDDNVQTLRVDSLDRQLAGEHPTAVKIDVEGWEQQVLNGARDALASASLLAVILELNGSGDRYGFADADTHQIMLDAGFLPYRYAPFERQLIDLGSKHNRSGNTLYLRDIDQVRARVEAAPACTVREFAI